MRAPIGPMSYHFLINSQRQDQTPKCIASPIARKPIITPFPFPFAVPPVYDGEIRCLRSLPQHLRYSHQALRTIDSRNVYSRHWDQAMSEIVVSAIATQTQKSGTERILMHWRVQATLIFSSKRTMLSPGTRNTVQCTIFDTVMARDTGEVFIE